MKNRGIKIFAGFLAILIIVFLVLSFSLDGIVKSAIKESGSELLQTEVNVDDVHISLFDGSGVIKGFVVHNPEGFSDEPAIQIRETRMKIDLSTIFSDPIVVENVTIKNPELFFEQKGIGANLKTLNDNMGLSDDSSETSMVIDHLLIENGTVRVSTTIERERTVEASISQFELNGIGRDGSNTIKQSIHQIMEPLLERAMREAVASGVMEQLENKVRDLFQGNEQ